MFLNEQLQNVPMMMMMRFVLISFDCFLCWVIVSIILNSGTQSIQMMVSGIPSEFNSISFEFQYGN